MFTRYWQKSPNLNLLLRTEQELINKGLEIYKIEVEKDISEEKPQEMDIFCDKCFKTIL